MLMSPGLTVSCRSRPERACWSAVRALSFETVCSLTGWSVYFRRRTACSRMWTSLSSGCRTGNCLRLRTGCYDVYWSEWWYCLFREPYWYGMRRSSDLLMLWKRLSCGRKSCSERRRTELRSAERRLHFHFLRMRERPLKRKPPQMKSPLCFQPQRFRMMRCPSIIPENCRRRLSIRRR